MTDIFYLQMLIIIFSPLSALSTAPYTIAKLLMLSVQTVSGSVLVFESIYKTMNHSSVSFRAFVYIVIDWHIKGVLFTKESLFFGVISHDFAGHSWYCHPSEYCLWFQGCAIHFPRVCGDLHCTNCHGN